MNHIDDETKRQFYSEQIRWWIQQADEELSALKDERKLISFGQNPQQIIPTTTTTTTTTRQMPINGPFNVVKTKDQLYREAVGGPGYRK